MKLIVLATALLLSACASSQANYTSPEPAYWMKQYVSADQEKVKRCVIRAQTEYDRLVTNTAFGVGPILEKGIEWEKCMDGR